MIPTTVSECLNHPPEKVVSFVQRLVQEVGAPSKQDRRSQPRKAICVPVIVHPLDEQFQPRGEPFSAVTKDISGGGVGLIHSEVIDSAYLQIEFTIPNEQQMSLLGHVRHCTRCGPSYHIGARFVVDWNAWRDEASWIRDCQNRD